MSEQTEKSTKKFTPKKGEEDLVHALIAPAQQFNPRTGERIASPHVMKTDARSWKQFLEHPAGYEVLEVLHLPKGAVSPEAIAKEKADKLKAEIERAKNAGRK